MRFPMPSTHIDPDLLTQLRSPHTGQPLTVDGNGHLLDGHHQSAGKIVDGIPRFVSDRHLASFGHQWTTFDVAHRDEDRATFAAKTGVTPDELSGLRILDAGCGGGRYARVCGEAGAVVVGADHTRAVDQARRLCADLPRVHFLQADLKHLPLEPASFDLVFSIGVMHHDADTRAVFDAVARMVRPGGRYSVWLYRRNQWWQEWLNSGLRCLTTRMPVALLMPFCHLGAILGGIPLINRTLNKIINFSAHPNYENRVCDTFDWWAPKYQHHHTTEELANWFEQAGFEHITVLPPEKTGALYRWTWRNNLLIGSGVNVSGIRKQGAGANPYPEDFASETGPSSQPRPSSLI